MASTVGWSTLALPPRFLRKAALPWETLGVWGRGCTDQVAKLELDAALRSLPRATWWAVEGLPCVTVLSLLRLPAKQQLRDEKATTRCRLLWHVRPVAHGLRSRRLCCST